MDTNPTRQISLQAGEALPADLPRGARVFLAEGEMLVQGPAEWLGGTVVLQPARRVTAPAMLDVGTGAGAALGAVRLVVEAAPALPQRMAAAFQRLRSAWHRAPQPARG